MNRPFAFFCPSCSRRVEAYEEHTGQQLTCPGCGDHFIVPRASWAWKTFPEANQEFPRIFSGEELALLSGVDASVLAHLAGATNRNYWEFYLLSALLRFRIEPLRVLLLQYSGQETTATRGLFRKTCAVEGFFELISQEMLDAGEAMYPLLIDAVEPALYGDSVEYILNFVDGFIEPIQHLCGAYGQLVQNPVPPDFPYPNIVFLLKGWAFHYWQTLDTFAERIRALAADKGGRGLPQISLIPPTLHEYYVLYRQIPREEQE